MIKAFRADDRLIHGQVQTQWISTYGVNRVMIIDSNVVRDPINVQILKLAKPAGIDLVICDEEKAMNLIAKDAAQPAARTFVIFKSHWCFFLIGFLAYSVFGISAVTLTILAICLAVIIDQTKAHNGPSAGTDDLAPLE